MSIVKESPGSFWAEIVISVWSFRSGLRRDLIIVFATEFVLLLSMIVNLWLASRYWEMESFGCYVTVRRLLGSLQLAVLCGTGLALPRYVALAKAGHEEVSPGGFLAAGFGIVMVSTAATGALCLSFSSILAELVFGASGDSGLIRSQVLAIVGLSCHSLLYGWLRGRMEMATANLLQLGVLGVLPFVVFLIPNRNVSQHVALLGLGWIGLAGSPLVYILACQPRQIWQPSRMFASVVTLLRYGLLRLPGDAAYGALWAVPVALTGRLHGLEAAGYLGLGVTAMLMIGSLVAPIGQIILPRASVLSASGDMQRLRRDAFLLFGAAVMSASFLVLGFQILGYFLLQMYVGDKAAVAMPPIQILVLAGVPYTVYVALRNILDALSVTPFNTKNLVLALLAFLLLSVFAKSPTFTATALAASVLMLGGLTAWDCLRLLYPRSTSISNAEHKE